MKRLAFRAVLVALVPLGCGKPRPAPAPEAERPAVGLVVAPPPRAKLPTFVVRSVRPADDSATASRSFVASYGLTDRDAEQLARLPGVAGLVPVRAFASEVRHLDRAANGRVVATTADYADARALALAAGRFLDSDDEKDKGNVCVLGAGAADALFPFEDPIGQSVTLLKHEFKVVGVLKGSRRGSDRDVFVPLATSRVRFGPTIVSRTPGSRTAEKVELTEIVVRMKDVAQVDAGTEAVRRALQRDRPQGDWEIVTK